MPFIPVYNGMPFIPLYTDIYGYAVHIVILVPFIPVYTGIPSKRYILVPVYICIPFMPIYTGMPLYSYTGTVHTGIPVLFIPVYRYRSYRYSCYRKCQISSKISPEYLYTGKTAKNTGIPEENPYTVYTGTNGIGW